LREAQWLVDHNPTIPHYARCKALVLAKLAAVCAETGRWAEAANLFQQALQTQEAAAERFPDLPAHDRVLCEFFRLRLAATYHHNNAVDGRTESSRVCGLLETCVRNLTTLSKQPRSVNDRLASVSLDLAKDALRRISAD
jgi:hypothetical protein